MTVGCFRRGVWIEGLNLSLTSVIVCCSQWWLLRCCWWTVALVRQGLRQQAARVVSCQKTAVMTVVMGRPWASARQQRHTGRA